MAEDGRADCDYDGRYRALVLLATFASLRWGEVTALKRCDLDLESGLVPVRAAFSDARTRGSKITLGPLKSRAGRRTVGIPDAIIPALRDHLSVSWLQAGHRWLCWREGITASTEQLQQDVGLELRGRVDRRARSAFP